MLLIWRFEFCSAVPMFCQSCAPELKPQCFGRSYVEQGSGVKSYRTSRNGILRNSSGNCSRPYTIQKNLNVSFRVTLSSFMILSTFHETELLWGC